MLGVSRIVPGAQRGVRRLHLAQTCGGHVMVDGLRLNYRVEGSGSKVALCLPGALGTIESDFGPQLKSLPDQGVKLVCWDPPGYGQSRPPLRQYSTDFLRRDATLAATMMKKLGYDKYSLLGWSDGGISAMILAAAFPDSVERLLVWGANAYITHQDIQIYKSIRDINNWSERMRASLEATYGKEYFKSAWEGWVDMLIQILEEEDGNLCRGDLSRITCPTLIIHGAKDPVVALEHPQYLKDNISGAQLVVMDKGKHNLHLRFPEEFNTMVTQFLLQD